MTSVLLLWPTGAKRDAFNHLQAAWKLRKERLESLRPTVLQAWAAYRFLRRGRSCSRRLEKARQRRDELAALLASLKYQLIHTDWRSLRNRV